jgi:hypothetical protein
MMVRLKCVRFEVTGWQAHSVRGFISGTLRKKQGITIELVKDAKEPTYRVATA